MLESITDGFLMIMHWQNMLAIVLGLYMGCIIGALPGLSPSMAIALAAPFTFGLPPVTALSFLLGVYKGGVYGGSLSAILLAAPGTPEAAATIYDGFPLAKSGRARQALDAALYASISGDLIGTIILITAAPFVAHYALKIGPVEMVPMIMLALAVIITTLGHEKIKGFLAAAIGGMVALIGIDPIEGSTRFVFGNFELSDGISLIPFLVGLFAMPEVISVIIGSLRKNKQDKGPRKTNEEIEVQGERLTLREVLPYWKTIVRSAIIGSGIGALPGLGSTAAAFTCYGLAKKASKHPELFGKGSIEGVLAAETGNNGTCGPALIPLITLGIPGSSTTAVLFGALLIYGIVPGPKIFIEHGAVVYAIFIGLIIGGLLLYPVALSIIKYASKGIYKINQGLLFSGIFLLCFTGSYAIRNSMLDVYCMAFAGVLAIVMRYFALPLGPTLIAFILTPILESSFRQSLMISGNNLSVFFSTGIAVFLWAIMIFIVLYGPIRVFLKNRQAKLALTTSPKSDI
ncbi:tripartite tricarboxylate transporter permease [Pelobacter seleniigenes]|uniref:tripartite tricarboxylate transporter permease n=1 Tax=Pelobacter seleniigenes TaxID=407188 RepID=UPI0004A7865E|nr:tripartite tricarboxylate transporter permease [Pelobacter seleniigenes]